MSSVLTAVLLLLITALLLCTQFTAARSNVDRNFQVYLPQVDYSGTQAETSVYVVSKNYIVPTQVNWTRYRNADVYESTQEAVLPTVLEYHFHALTYQLDQPSTFLSISANSSVAVIVHTDRSYSGTRGRTHNITPQATFMSLPHLLLGQEYTIVTECVLETCLLTIVSIREKVDVNISLRMTPEIGIITHGNQQYGNGGVIQASLNRREVLEIKSGSVDLTGSRVVSSAPVAVLSGGYLAISEGGTVSLIDGILEQMPPETMAGTEYVVVAFPEKTLATYVKITHINNKPANITQVPINLQLKSQNSNFQYWVFIDTSQSTVLTSDVPVLVELIAGPNQPATTDPNAAGVILIPVDRWGFKYVNVVLKTLIILVARKECASGIQLNNDVICEIWDPIGETSYATTEVKVYESEPKSIFIQSFRCPLSGYLLGENHSTYSAWPLGWSRAAKNMSEPDNTTVGSSTEWAHKQSTDYTSYTVDDLTQSTPSDSYTKEYQKQSTDSGSYTEEYQKQSTDSGSYTEQYQTNPMDFSSYTEYYKQQSTDFGSYTEGYQEQSTGRGYEQSTDSFTDTVEFHGQSTNIDGYTAIGHEQSTDFRSYTDKSYEQSTDPATEESNDVSTALTITDTLPVSLTTESSASHLTAEISTQQKFAEMSTTRSASEKPTNPPFSASIPTSKDITENISTLQVGENVPVTMPTAELKVNKSHQCPCSCSFKYALQTRIKPDHLINAIHKNLRLERKELMSYKRLKICRKNNSATWSERLGQVFGISTIIVVCAVIIWADVTRKGRGIVTRRHFSTQYKQ